MSDWEWIESEGFEGEFVDTHDSEYLGGFASSTIIVINDSGIGIDIPSCIIVSIVLDSGAGISISIFVVSVIVLSEIGIGIDTVYLFNRESEWEWVNTSATEFIDTFGTEWIQEEGYFIPILDSGIGTDILSQTADIIVADSVIGSETNLVLYVSAKVEEEGIGIDTVNSDDGIWVVSVLDVGEEVEEVVSVIFSNIIAEEIGTGIDTVLSLAAIVVLDSGVGSDLVFVNVSSIVYDSIQGSDGFYIFSTQIVSITDEGIVTQYCAAAQEPYVVFDFGTQEGALVIGISITIADELNGNEALVFTPSSALVEDTGLYEDSAELFVLSSITDVLTGIDITETVMGSIVIIDSGEYADCVAGFKALIISDSAIGVEEISKSSIVWVSDSAIGTDIVTGVMPFMSLLLNSELVEQLIFESSFKRVANG